jgi:hypothetical protein
MKGGIKMSYAESLKILTIRAMIGIFYVLIGLCLIEMICGPFWFAVSIICKNIDYSFLNRSVIAFIISWVVGFGIDKLEDRS